MALGGLTPEGFIAPTVQEILEDTTTKILANVDAGLDLSADQPIGQVIAIIAEKMAEIWEFQSTIYNAMNPDAAEDQLLDNVSAITGTRRRSASYSSVVATVNLNGAGTTLPAGTVASVAGQPTNRWIMTAPVTNSGVSSANFSSTWRSEQPGPFVANATTLTVRETPVIGWNSISNPTDAKLGIPEDTDSVLRIERENELSAAGSGTADGIRADVLQVPGVLQCFVYENDSNVTDINGVPAHSFRVVVWDGPSLSASDTDIAQAIWNSKGGGIGTYGATTANAADSQGNIRAVNFDRAVQIPIYMRFYTTPSSIDAGTIQAVKDAAVAYALANQNLGTAVIALAYRSVALESSNVLQDVPTLELGLAPSPSGQSNIAISGLQIATLDTSHILVNGL